MCANLSDNLDVRSMLDVCRREFGGEIRNRTHVQPGWRRNKDVQQNKSDVVFGSSSSASAAVTK
jgi:hypothetical protein